MRSNGLWLTCGGDHDCRHLREAECEIAKQNMRSNMGIVPLTLPTVDVIRPPLACCRLTPIPTAIAPYSTPDNGALPPGAKRSPAGNSHEEQEPCWSGKPFGKQSRGGG